MMEKHQCIWKNFSAHGYATNNWIATSLSGKNCRTRHQFCTTTLTDVKNTAKF